MKKKHFLSLVLTGIISLTMLAGCGSTVATDTSKSTDTVDAPKTSEKVHFTMLNTKGEIQPQLEAMAKIYSEKTGNELEVYVAGAGSSPAEFIAQKYAAGDPPTIAMLDPIDIYRIAEEKGLPLNDEKWVSEGGKELGIHVNSNLYSFPFCVEGRGLIYNKKTIEDITGKPFVESDINSLEKFSALLKELVAGGMESPVILNKEDWSLGAHFLTLVYEEQDGTEATAIKFTDAMKKGEVKLIENERFNSIFDTFDVLKENNINKKDPMAADYDRNASYLASGKSAFWFNGNWGWAEISTYVEDDAEYGFIPVIQDTSPTDFANTKIQAGGSKQLMIDKEKATQAQQDAAKDFLNWLVFDEQGQSTIVNDCNLIPAFKNIKLELTNPLAVSIKKYSDSGNLFEGFNASPGDHWSTLGASMQKYLANQIDREGLAKEIETYWAKQK